MSDQVNNSAALDMPASAADGNLAREVRRRRTFAIISHPDAGKTTLTEKLLLFGGAIQMAGTVKARKSGRHATSDWLEIEKQRGISVASSVMQFTYDDCVINLLDTPGHQDFSEDTYRVLTAVDAPVTWPIGMGKRFQGVYHLLNDEVMRFTPGEAKADQEVEVLKGSQIEQLAQQCPSEMQTMRDETELVSGAGASFDLQEFLRGQQSPVFFGSGINNFGVREVLRALVDWAPSPLPRSTS